MKDADTSGEDLTIGSPTLQMAFACENITTDANGRVSFINLIDSLTSVSFPTTTAQMFVIFGFTGQLAQFIQKPRIVIEDEQQKPVVEAPLKDMAMTADAPVARAIVGLQGLQWPHAGRYLVKFWGNKKILGAFPVMLLKINLPGLPGGPTLGAPQ